MGQAVNKGSIDGVVNFLHSEDVVKMIKKGIGARAGGLSDADILAKFSIPKHQIKQLLEGHESLTDDILDQLADTLSSQVHAELTETHPGRLADIAYTEGIGTARNVLKGLYAEAGGSRYARDNKKTIDELADPGRVMQHTTQLYQQRTLYLRSNADRAKTRKPVGKAA